jgi:TrpR family trp operon transcriptional repressor
VSTTILDIARLLVSTGDEQLAAEFLSQLLTPAEVRRVEQRWELVKLLEAGLTQRDIASRLGISLCNITRGSRELKKPDSAFRAILNQLELKEDGSDKSRSQ